jgi:HTH-type transcriptional regulator / antitoxin HigA
MDDVAPHELLQHSMESNGTSQADLVGLIGSREVVSEVVNGKRAISKSQAKALSEFFNVSPGLFI